MHDDFLNNLKWHYSSYSTPDLLDIWAERKREDSSYIEETFEAVRQILSERGAIPSEQQRSDRRDEEDHPSRRDTGESFSFPCVFCTRKLRIHLPMDSGLYSCPSCSARYEPVRIHGDPAVMLLVPKRPGDTDREAASRAERRTVTPEVKAALSVLGLTESANFEEAKQAYRSMVKQYHPDRVSHLGLELKILAENKTKELIAAYETIKRFFLSGQE